MEDRYRGRLFVAVGTTTSLMGLLGIGLASVLGEIAGIVPMLNISVLLYASAGAIALLLSRSALIAQPATNDANMDRELA